jgi:hypothetical protein
MRNDSPNHIVFNHPMRSWLFAEAIGRIKGIDYDREVVAIGTDTPRHRPHCQGVRAIVQHWRAIHFEAIAVHQRLAEHN